MADRLTPDYWLNRADEARAVAAELRDAQQKRIMIGIADAYEQLAKGAERLDKSFSILGKEKPSRK